MIIVVINNITLNDWSIRKKKKAVVLICVLFERKYMKES